MTARNHLFLLTFTAFFLTVACVLGFMVASTPTPWSTVGAVTATPSFPATLLPTDTLGVTPKPAAQSDQQWVPNFSHMAIVVFENKGFDAVVGNRHMGYFNILAESYTLLTQYYAVAHPGLPNYLAMMGGETFGVEDDCMDCFIDGISLPDLIEASGRTWKTYQERMPEPCFTGSTPRYFQKHNPFIYFDSIRWNAERCTRSIVPLTRLDEDIASGSLSNFIFIAPDICHSTQDCALEFADAWLDSLLNKLIPPLNSSGKPYLVILTWDQGRGTESCCGLPEQAGGRVATVLVSPQVKNGFTDGTPYSHYSILKTISTVWGLPYLGHAADEATAIITAPWK